MAKKGGTPVARSSRETLRIHKIKTPRVRLLHDRRRRPKDYDPPGSMPPDFTAKGGERTEPVSRMLAYDEDGRRRRVAVWPEPKGGLILVNSNDAVFHMPHPGKDRAYFIGQLGNGSEGPLNTLIPPQIHISRGKVNWKGIPKSMPAGYRGARLAGAKPKSMKVWDGKQALKVERWPHGKGGEMLVAHNGDVYYLAPGSDEALHIGYSGTGVDGEPLHELIRKGVDYSGAQGRRITVSHRKVDWKEVPNRMPRGFTWARRRIAAGAEEPKPRHKIWRGSRAISVEVWDHDEGGQFLVGPRGEVYYLKPGSETALHIGHSGTGMGGEPLHSLIKREEK